MLVKISATSFGKKYRYLVFESSYLKGQSKISSIRMNHCNNPFCKWFGLPQQKFDNVKIEHTMPSIDEGVRYVDCITNLSDKSPIEVANYLARVNSHSINALFNQIRRSISILERPLVTAGGEGKSYIYSNYNPKCAQYSITILRTFYNFCWTFKSGNGDVLTPAQRIGITDKQFNYNDIIFFLMLIYFIILVKVEKLVYNIDKQ